MHEEGVKVPAIHGVQMEAANFDDHVPAAHGWQVALLLAPVEAENLPTFSKRINEGWREQ